jgi:hypothetical protein
LDVVLVQDWKFQREKVLEQVEEGVDLFAWAFPVLGGEREEGQAFDAEFGACRGDGADGSGAAAVSFHAGQTALCGPASVTVHDDRDMTRHRRLYGGRFSEEGVGGRGVQGAARSLT